MVHTPQVVVRTVGLYCTVSRARDRCGADYFASKVHYSWKTWDLYCWQWKLENRCKLYLISKERFLQGSTRYPNQFVSIIIPLRAPWRKGEGGSDGCLPSGIIWIPSPVSSFLVLPSSLVLCVLISLFSANDPVSWLFSRNFCEILR